MSERSRDALHPFALTLTAPHWTTSYGGTGGSIVYSGDATGGGVGNPTDAVSLRVSAASVGSAVSRGREAPGELASRWCDNGGDVAARVDFTSGSTDADGAALVGIGSPSSGGAWCAVRCGGDGNCRIVDSTGADHTTDVSGPSPSETAGGNLWLRFTSTPVGVAASWGIADGPDAMPATWHCVGVACTVDVVNAARGGAPIIGAIATGGGVAGGLACEFSCIALAGPTALAARDGRRVAPYGGGDSVSVSMRRADA